MAYFMSPFADSEDAALQDAMAATRSGGVLGVDSSGEAAPVTPSTGSTAKTGVITFGLLVSFVIGVGLIFGSARR